MDQQEQIKRGLFHIKLNSLRIPQQANVMSLSTTSKSHKKMENIKISEGDEFQLKFSLEEGDKRQIGNAKYPKRNHKTQSFSLTIPPDSFYSEQFILRNTQKPDANIIAFECIKEDRINIKMYRNKKKNVAIGKKDNEYICFCSFPIQKLVQLPNITHQIDIKLVSPHIDRKIQQIAILDVSIIYSEYKIGYLKFNMKQFRTNKDVYSSYTSWNPYLIMTTQNGKVFRSKALDSENPVWNFQDQIAFNNFFTKMEIRLNLQAFIDKKVGIKTFDLIEEGMLKCTEDSIKRQMYLQDIMSGNTIKKKHIGKLLFETRFVFDFDALQNQNEDQ